MSNKKRKLKSKRKYAEKLFNPFTSRMDALLARANKPKPNLGLNNPFAGLEPAAHEMAQELYARGGMSREEQQLLGVGAFETKPVPEYIYDKYPEADNVS